MDTTKAGSKNSALFGLLDQFGKNELDRMINFLNEYRRERFPEVSDGDDDLEQRAANALKKIGVQTHLDGYKCLKIALVAVAQDENLLKTMTNGLYPLVAKEHGTTPSCVERNIRKAIETTWDRCANQDVKDELFGNTISHVTGKPTNGQFIAVMSDYVRETIHR